MVRNRYNRGLLSNYAPSTEESLGYLIGSAIAGNMAQRQDDKDSKADMDMLANPVTGNSNATENVGNFNTGLLSTQLPYKTQEQQLHDAAGVDTNFNPAMSQQPNTAAQNTIAYTPSLYANKSVPQEQQGAGQPNYTTRQRTLQDAEKEYMTAFGQRAQQVLGGMSAEGRRQYGAQILAQRDIGLNQLRSDWKTRDTNDALNEVMGAQSPAAQKAALVKYAQKSGNMDLGTLKGLLQTNVKNYDDGANINFFRTDSMGNPIDVGEDGKPTPYYSIAKQMSPNEIANNDYRNAMLAETQRHNSATEANSAARYSGGGGYSGGSAKPTKWENYGNSKDAANDLALLSEYQDRLANGEGSWDPVLQKGIKPSEQTKYNQAASRYNAYLAATQGGDQGQEEQPTPQSLESDTNQRAQDSYYRVWQQIHDENPNMSEDDVTKAVEYVIRQNGG